jgi:mono/diheme cytochrome c family protein
VTYRGPATAAVAAARAPAARADNSAPDAAVPPEGIHPDAGRQATAALPTPPGATPEQVAIGDRIYHGQVASAPCAGCHGTDGKGSPVGPDLTSGKWLWGDGSLAAIAHTITVGVPQPKQYGSPMPPMGGAQLSPSQLSAVAAYVWALGHRSGG